MLTCARTGEAALPPNRTAVEADCESKRAHRVRWHRDLDAGCGKERGFSSCSDPTGGPFLHPESIRTLASKAECAIRLLSAGEVEMVHNVLDGPPCNEGAAPSMNARGLRPVVTRESRRSGLGRRGAVGAAEGARCAPMLVRAPGALVRMAVVVP